MVGRAGGDVGARDWKKGLRKGEGRWVEMGGVAQDGETGAGGAGVVEGGEGRG